MLFNALGYIAKATIKQSFILKINNVRFFLKFQLSSFFLVEPTAYFVKLEIGLNDLSKTTYLGRGNINRLGYRLISRPNNSRE